MKLKLNPSLYAAGVKTMFRIRRSFRSVRLLAAASCAMLLLAGNAQAQTILPGTVGPAGMVELVAELAAVRATPGGFFPGGFLANFTADGEFLHRTDGNKNISITAVNAQVPTFFLTQYTGLTDANVAGSRAVFVVSRTGFGRVCKIICNYHGTVPSGSGERDEPSGPPLHVPDPITGAVAMVHIWELDYQTRDGATFTNFGALGSRMLVDDPLAGAPGAPNILPGDKVKLAFVGGDNVISFTFRHPDFFFEPGTAPVRFSGDLNNIADPANPGIVVLP